MTEHDAGHPPTHHHDDVEADGPGEHAAPTRPTSPTAPPSSAAPRPAASQPATADEIARASEAVLAEVRTAVVGMPALSTALACVLAGGHLLLEDVPGTGKTLAARSLATALGLDFARVQCTPDLLPSDVTGSMVFDPARTAFEFRPGPVFTGMLLADEINRTPPKTQSALLEAMAERQVTVEGVTRPLPHPFHVIATSNPVEHEGTYPLPEAQLDRFMARLAVGYLDGEGETALLERRLARRQEAAPVRTVLRPGELAALQAGVEQVAVERDVLRYCVDLTAATRSARSVEVGASPRGTQALVLLARARAVMAGRDYTTPEDVKSVAVPALAHRLVLTPQAWAAGTSPVAVVADLLDHVPTPGATASLR
ncbi:MoxR family ATPase [Miniimonas arenae]|uniref:MoxR family ATPase n=1 Tax=Miniimonas arenae TaxID=676201 RepID=A0A5C5BCJ6_9MICO|nr:MoxR family ATPase [Miniimonas arenae]TNU75785.1 MoxR family ATPase [Miniimonas arenae]